MSREKIKRKLNFHPIIKHFAPTKKDEINGNITLFADEFEAIYLSEILKLYQEDAAKKMEISRPTFTRILKSARSKLAQAIISGYQLNIENETIFSSLAIAVCKDNLNSDRIGTVYSEYIVIYRFENNILIKIEEIKNIVDKEKNKPAIALTKSCLDKGVNVFISSKIGEGLKYALISKGIKPIIQNSFNKEKINLYL